MEISRWKFEFEFTPSLIGVGFFVALGVAGFVGMESRMVFFPAAFLAGVITGLLSRTHAMTGNNSIVVTVVGFALIMAFSASQNVSSMTGFRDMGIGDQLFLGAAFFLAEATFVFALILPLGYGGALLIGVIRKRREPGTEPRNIRNLGR